MTVGHWAVWGLIAAFLGVLLCYSLFALPGSRISRLAKRLVWSGLFLGLGLLPVRLNPVSLAAAACLGMPGVGLLLAVRLL